MSSDSAKLAMDSEAKDWDLQLGKLRLAEGASFDSMLNQHEALCMTETRVELLRELHELISSTQSPILWLSGMAGTGKSTIARTMAKELNTHHRLAGNFFFRRTGSLSGAGNFVSTLAHQLANNSQLSTSPSFKKLVGEAIRNHSEVLLQGLRSQWKELIVGPLSRLKSSQRLALAFVVDALDECGSEDDIRLILQLFIELKDLNNIDINVLITSRPETTLLRGLQKRPEIMHRRLDLRDVPRQVVERDLYVYMEKKLGQIKSQGRFDWLKEEDLGALVQKADCLFIYAATVCLFIESGYDTPEDCVFNILQSGIPRGGDTAAIDEMYTQVLSSALARPGQRKEITERLTDRFKKVVGSIITVLEMQSITALGSLISMKVETVKLALDLLESVLNIPNDMNQPVRLIHPSFRDFLLDDARCKDKQFHVQRETAHFDLAIGCLDILFKCLRKDVCNLELPDSPPQKVSEDLLDHHLPKHVQYACQYWTGHLGCVTPHQRIQLGLCDDGRIHEFFTERYLFWLEAMSIMGKMPETVLMMNALSAMLESDEYPALHAIVKDATRFLLSNINIVQKAPLQVYASALVFSPRESQIRKKNLAHYPTWFKYGPDVPDHWGNVLQTLQGHSAMVAAAAWSFDGKYLASQSCDYEVLLWDTMTGTLHTTLSGSPDDLDFYNFNFLTFARNGQLVSFSSKYEARIWDPATGATCHTLVHDEHKSISAVAFAADGTLAVSYEGTPAQTWIYKAGKPLISVETQSGVISSSFMSEGTLALVCSDSYYDGFLGRFRKSAEGEILLYDPETHTERRIPTAPFDRLSFSSNDQLALYDHKVEVIRVHNLRTGSCQTFKTNGNFVAGLAFSMTHSGLFVAYTDNSIYYMDLESRTETFIWNSVTEFRLVAHSPDGRLAIAGYWEHEIQILEVESDPKTGSGDVAITSASNESRMLKRAAVALHRIKYISFSHNGKQLACASSDHICVLDPATRRELRVFPSKEIGPITIGGNYLACGDEDGKLRVWDLASGNLLQRLMGHLHNIYAIAFSPDNTTLVSVGWLNDVKFRDSKTCSLQHTLTLSDVANSTAFSQSGKRVAFLLPRSVEIWDAKKYTCLQSFRVKFPYHESLFQNQISFFADETYIDTTFGRVLLDRISDDPPNEGSDPPDSDSDEPNDDRKWFKVEPARWRVHKDWLYRDGQKKLLLPSEFRASCTAIYDDLLVLGHSSGKVTFFKDNTDDTTPEQAHEASASEEELKATDRAQEYFHRSEKSVGKQKA